MSDELLEKAVSDWNAYDTGSHKDIKKIIQDNINSVCANYVAIGYYLNVINNRKLYEEDGYSGIGEYAAAEYGIQKDKCSYLMKIADKFCIPNSPALLPEYRDFTVSKLREMIYLTDEQLEQVTITTTVAEIREIRKPESDKVATSQVEPVPKLSYLKCAAYDFNKFGKGCSGCFYDKAENNCPYDRTEYFAEIKRREEWDIHCQVCKEMCDCLCKMGSYVLEKNNYSMDAIKSLSRKVQEFSFGFGDDGAGHSRYMARCKAEKYHVEEFNGSGKWTFEAGEVDQQIWNVNGNGWRRDHQEITEQPETMNDTQEPENDVDETVDNEPESIDDLDFTVRTYNCLKRAGIDTVDQLCELTEEDVIKIRNISQKCLDEIKLKLSEIGQSLKPDATESVEIIPEYKESVNETMENVIEEPESVTDEVGDEPDQVETVEADIIQTVSEKEYDFEAVSQYGLPDIKSAILVHQQNIASYIDCKLDAPIVKREKMEMDALQVLEESLYIHDTPDAEDIPKAVQPELPVLKNNDQRKDFIDDYETWPIWIDLLETGERYYRYNLSNKVAFVVKVSRKHSHENYHETKDYEYSAEQYYLLGIKSEWHQTGAVYTEDDSRTFYECSSNKSALVDYLRYFQKKGA